MNDPDQRCRPQNWRWATGEAPGGLNGQLLGDAELSNVTFDGCRYTNSVYFMRGTSVAQLVLDDCLLDSLGASNVTVIIDRFSQTHNRSELFHVLPGHPAFPGRGVRARRDIAPGEELGYYAGVCRPRIFGADNSYIFDLNVANRELAVDACEYGNITR